MYTFVYIGVAFVIFVLEVIYLAIWTLVLCKLGENDFDEALSKGLIFVLVGFTLLFSRYLTDKIIENNGVGIISETVSENGGE